MKPKIRLKSKRMGANHNQSHNKLNHQIKVENSTTASKAHILQPNK